MRPGHRKRSGIPDRFPRRRQVVRYADIPLQKGDRQVIGAVLTFTNVTAFRASIDQVIYERECAKAILNTVADPIVVLSADQRIQSGNRAFYTLFLELASLRTKLKAILAGSRAFQPVEVDHVIPGEGQRTLILDARPLSLPGHSERRILVTFQDITARKQAEAANDLRAIAERKEELRRSEAFLAEAQRLSLTGSFYWRVPTDEITWSEQLYRIFGFDQGALVTPELIGSRVHPEDIPLLHDIIERARGAGTDFECEYRLQMPDESVKYLHMVAHAHPRRGRTTGVHRCRSRRDSTALVGAGAREGAIRARTRSQGHRSQCFDRVHRARSEPAALGHHHEREYLSADARRGPAGRRGRARNRTADDPRWQPCR